MTIFAAFELASRMPLGSPLQTQTYRVFVSSGTDADELRDRVENLFEIASDVLGHHESRLRFDVVRWENAAPQRAGGQGVNAIFVEWAKKANMTIALLINEIRSGTLEELNAVLDQTTNELAVLQFLAKGKYVRKGVRDFLDARRDQILYKRVGDKDSSEAWLELARIAMDVLLRAAKQAGTEGGLFFEDRQ